MRDVLFLAHRVPFPPDRGDKIRSYHVLKHLAAKAHVHLLAFADDPRDLALRPELAVLTASYTILPRRKSQVRTAIEALARGKPVSLTAFDDAAMRVAVTDALARHKIDTIYVFSSQMAQYLPIETRATTIMDFVDMDSAKFAAYGTGRGPFAWLTRREARLLRGYEADVAESVDASVLVSEAEAALFARETGTSNVHAIENGIDIARFDPSCVMPVAAPGPLIVFTGQMDYRPNIEAVAWFARDILPLVRRHRPDAAFAIVGRAPTAEVRALAALPGVSVTGEVEDVRGWLAAAAIVVAPLKLARGVQNKVLEAMAMARPVVASTAAAEGIDHAGTIRIGHDADTLAGELIALLANPDAAATLGAAARARVIDRYGWEACLAPLDALLAHDSSAGTRAA